MHRSGTSAIARVVNLAGAYFGAEGTSTPANEENRKGFWEREDVRALNDAVLHSTRHDWDVVADFDLAAIPRQELGTLRSRAAEIVAKLDAHRPWFIKEPRLCLLLPLWRPLLEFPVCVHIFRNPLEVARSLKARNDIPIAAGLALWEAYNVSALAAADGLPRIFVSYQDLMHSPAEATASLCSHLSEYGGYPMRVPGRPELAGFLSARLHHQRAGVEALREVANDAQIRLFTSLQDLRGRGVVSRVPAADLSRSAREALRSYEGSRHDVAASVRAANAARMRRQQTESATQLALKAYELDRTLTELGEARRRLTRESAELSRLGRRLAAREEQVRNLTSQRRELSDELARQTAAHYDVRNDLNESLRELGAAKDENRRQALAAVQLRQELGRAAAAKESARRETERLRAKRRALTEEVARQAAARRRERSRLMYDNQELAGLAGQLQVGVKALLASRRWRLGHAILSLPRRLLLRPSPPTAVQTLAPLVDRSLPAAGGSAAAATGQQATTPQPARHHRPTVAVLAWDVGHNPYGRAYLLAEALARRYRVVLMGFQFPRYGGDVWAPLRGAAIEPVVLPGNDFPAFQRQLESLAAHIDADVVIACKARLPTVQLGLMLKAVRNRPLIVDVDDHELSFFAKNEGPLASVVEQPADALLVPHEEVWTRRTEALLPFADELLVSNLALQSKFGGVMVPHGRDEGAFDPTKFDRAEARRQLGFGEQDKLVFFIGTPRPHKGLLELVAAVHASGVEACRLVVVGTPPDKAFGEALGQAGGERLTMLADQPFDALPGLLAAADLVCLLQDPTSAISRFQLPAKLIDALAMGIPVLATATTPIEDLVAAGLVRTASRESGPRAIRALLTMSEDDRAQHSRRARQWFLESGSHQAILRDLSDVIDRALAAPKKLPSAATRFLAEQEQRFGQRELAPAPDAGIDVVMFWKQNDIGLYGRRFDMVVAHLALRSDIRRIAVFEPPLPARLAEADLPQTDQNPLVVHRALLRSWRLMDTDKVSYHVYPEGGDSRPHGRSPGTYEDHVASELRALGVEPSEAVFWYYPYFEHTTAINGRLRPRLKVVDVVDDHRTWANATTERRARVDQHYRDVLEDADVVFANCEELQRSMAPLAGEVLLVPNGCDTRPGPPAARDYRFRRFSALKGPVLGLVGNLEPKTDGELLHKLATERPSYQLALIGSTHSAEPDLLRLQELPNVTFFGVVTYPEVRAWIARLDVGLVPHRDTEQTRAMNPLKVLAYATECVPTVSTQIDNLGDMEPFMRVASSHDDFVAGVDEVVDGRFQMDREALHATVQRNAWTERVDQMMAAIEKRLQ